MMQVMIGILLFNTEGTQTMRKLEITDTTALQSVIKEEVTHNHKLRFLHRLHCVFLLGRGFSCYQVAEWFDEHPRTVERWAHYFQKFGIEGLRDEQKTGRPTKLRDDQLKQLQNDILKAPCELGYHQNAWDGKLLQTYLERSHDVELSVRQCQRILHQLQHSETSHVAHSQ